MKYVSLLIFLISRLSLFTSCGIVKHTLTTRWHIPRSEKTNQRRDAYGCSCRGGKKPRNPCQSSNDSPQPLKTPPCITQKRRITASPDERNDRRHNRRTDTHTKRRNVNTRSERVDAGRVSRARATPKLPTYYTCPRFSMRSGTNTTPVIVRSHRIPLQPAADGRTRMQELRVPHVDGPN